MRLEEYANDDLREIRRLERIASRNGVLEDAVYSIKSTADMREEAWETYLVSQREYLEGLLDDAGVDY